MSVIDAVTSLGDELGLWPVGFEVVSSVVELPPLVAQAAFDAVRDDRTRTGQSWAVQVPGGLLELAGPGTVPPPPRACYWSYREVPGTIRLDLWPLAVPVRLELLPWARTRTELRLGVRRFPILAADGHYAHVAVRALDLLSAEVTRWGLHDVHGLEQWLRTQCGTN